MIYPSSLYLYGVFGGFPVRTGNDPDNYVAPVTVTVNGTLKTVSEVCGQDYNSTGSNSSYVYMYALMIR